MKDVIADLRYRWLITSGSLKILSAILKSTRLIEDSQQKDYSFLGNDTFPSLYDAQVYERKFKSEYLERQTLFVACDDSLRPPVLSVYNDFRR